MRHNNLFPFDEYSNPMTEEPAEGFDPAKPKEYKPWSSGEIQERIPSQIEEFASNLKNPLTALDDGFVGDTSRIIHKFLTGKEDYAYEIGKMQSVENQTDTQKGAISLLSELESMPVEEREVVGWQEAWDKWTDIYYEEQQKNEDNEPYMSISETFSALESNPGQVAAGFLNGVMENPQYLLVGTGWLSGVKGAAAAVKAAKAVSGTGKYALSASKATTAAYAGGVTGMAGAGAGIGAVTEIVDEMGSGKDWSQINWDNVKDDTLVSAYFGIGTGVGVAGFKMLTAGTKMGEKSTSKILLEFNSSIKDATSKEGLSQVGDLIMERQGFLPDKIDLGKADESIAEAADRVIRELGIDKIDGLDPNYTRKVMNDIVSRELSAVLKSDPERYIAMAKQGSAVKANKDIFDKANQIIDDMGLSGKVNVGRIISSAKDESQIKALMQDAILAANLRSEFSRVTADIPEHELKPLREEFERIVRAEMDATNGTADSASKSLAESVGVKGTLGLEKISDEDILFNAVKKDPSLLIKLKENIEDVELRTSLDIIFKEAKKAGDRSKQFDIEYGKAKNQIEVRKIIESARKDAGGTLEEAVYQSNKNLKSLSSLAKSQKGEVNARLAILMGATAGGVLIGDSVNEKIGYGILAPAAVIFGPSIIKSFKRVGSSARKAMKEADGLPQMVKKAMDYTEGEVKVAQRGSASLYRKFIEVVPDEKGRQRISLYLEGFKTVPTKLARSGALLLKAGEEIKLSNEERKMADEMRKSLDEMYDIAVKSGVLNKNTKRINFLPHYHADDFATEMSVLDSMTTGKQGISTTTSHSKKRVYNTYEDAVSNGKTPVTMDAATLLNRYQNEVIRTVENKKLITNLKSMKDDNGINLIAKSDDAPNDYVSINHPQLTGMKVNPEIVPSLKFFFDASDPSDVQKGLLAVNFAAKRMLVSTSLFHANALMESMWFAGMTSRKEYTSMLDMLKNGKAGDVIDIALRSGLEIGTIGDVGTDLFYNGLAKAKSVVDRYSPIAGSAIKGFEEFNKKVDYFMWDRVATGGKLATFSLKYEQALKNTEKYGHMNQQEIAESVSTFVNDAFGGLNWRRIAEETESVMGKKIAMSAFTPAGKRMSNLLMFAPDWTLSNFRVLLKALPGQTKNNLEADLYRNYMKRSAATFFVMGTAINSIIAGRIKPLWENEDPTKIELSDGRKMTIFKQTAEVMHLITDPGKTAMAKSGLIPKEVITQLSNKQYLSERGAPPISGKEESWVGGFGARAKHLGKNVLPIGVQQPGIPEAIIGSVGHPITGKPKDDL